MYSRAVASSNDGGLNMSKLGKQYENNPTYTPAPGTGRILLVCLQCVLSRNLPDIGRISNFITAQYAVINVLVCEHICFRYTNYILLCCSCHVFEVQLVVGILDNLDFLYIRMTVHF